MAHRNTAVFLVLLGLYACSSTRTRLPEAAVPATDSTASDLAPVDSEGPADTNGQSDAGTVDAAGCATAVGPPDRWYSDAVFYEVFVRSFQDSDDDGIGDIPGLMARLDYLNDGNPDTETDLGIDALWLMPINPSPSYHGYDVTNYRDIESDYGTLADFDALMAAAHSRGIRVILDLVVNHTSREHPWFVTGKRALGGVTDDWYVFRPDNPGWGQPWSSTGSTWHPIGDRFFYGVFWSGMPDLNFHNVGVRDEMLASADFWLQHKADGFRLDAARYLVENGANDGQSDQPETHVFWKQLRATATARNPESLLVGEVWTDFDTTRTYFGADDELQMVFAFDRAEAIRNGLRLGTAAPLVSALCSELTGAPTHGQMASFITNHDLDRVATEVGVDMRAEKLRLAATLLLTLPGTPFIYYGQELGLQNGSAAGDPGKRLPMRWDTTAHAGFTGAADPWLPNDASADAQAVSTQLADSESLLQHYRRLITLRKDEQALRRGRTIRLDTTANGGSVTAWLRTEIPTTGVGSRPPPATSVLIVANLGHEPATDIHVSVPEGVLAAGSLLTTLSGQGTASAVPAAGAPGSPSAGVALPTLGPLGAIILRLSASAE